MDRLQQLFAAQKALGRLLDELPRGHAHQDQIRQVYERLRALLIALKGVDASDLQPLLIALDGVPEAQHVGALLRQAASTP